jgi:hypothetical protein
MAGYDAASRGAVVMRWLSCLHGLAGLHNTLSLALIAAQEYETRRRIHIVEMG